MMLFEKQNQNQNENIESEILDRNLQADTLDEEVSKADNNVKEADSLPEKPVRQWRNDTLKRIDEDHKTHDEADIDHDLLLALGYVDGDKDKQKSDHKKATAQASFPESVYGMKKEYRDVREIPYIKQQFDKDARSLNIRLIGTAVSVLLIFIYPILSMMIKGKVEFFDAERFFGANLLICVDLMLISAAFSVIPLLRGLRGAFTMKPTLYSPSAMLILAQTAICIAYAFLTKGSTPAHVLSPCIRISTLPHLIRDDAA